MNEYVAKIKELISKNKANEALLILHKISKQDKEAEITVLTLLADYNELMIQQNRGTLNLNDLNASQRKLNVKILNVVNALSSDSKVDFKLIRKRNVGKEITLVLAILTVVFFTYLGVVLLFFDESNNDVLLVSMIGAAYGGVILFIGLIVTLVARAILNK